MKKQFAFVNYGNSREGSLISEALSQEGYFVYATRAPDPLKLNDLNPNPLTVDQFISSDIDTIVDTLKICKSVVYTILDTPKYATKIFTKLAENPGIRKKIVIVSPIFTWAGQPKAENWKQRWSHPSYTSHLSAERFLTGLNLRIFVMCVGLLFGEGESVLFPLFQAAWLSNETVALKKHPNIIPTLHVRDMARGAVAVFSSPGKPPPVFLAHDGSNTTRSALLKSVSSAFSLVHPRKVSDDEAAHLYGTELTDWLSLHFEMEAEDFAGLDFERHCPEGPIEKMDLVIDEFVKKRLLSPLKIVAIDIPPDILSEIVSYYGLEIASDENIQEKFELDKSEEAEAIKESIKEAAQNEEEESKENKVEVLKHVLSRDPSFRFHGYITEKVNENPEEREEFYFENEEPQPYFPKYVVTGRDFEKLEHWFIGKGSHCCKCITFEDVKEFLGLPRNFSREERLLEARRIQEQIESERLENELRRQKQEKAAEEEKKLQLMKRDTDLLKEVLDEIGLKKNYDQMTARTFLMQVVVPMFKKPLAQINEARVDDPLRFLASHFEAETNAK